MRCLLNQIMVTYKRIFLVIEKFSGFIEAYRKFRLISKVYAGTSSQNSGPETRWRSASVPTLASVAAFFNQQTFGFLSCSKSFQIHLVHSGLLRHSIWHAIGLGTPSTRPAPLPLPRPMVVSYSKQSQNCRKEIDFNILNIYSYWNKSIKLLGRQFSYDLPLVQILVPLVFFLEHFPLYCF